MAGLGVSFLSTRFVRRTKYIFVLSVFGFTIFFTNLYYLKRKESSLVLNPGIPSRTDNLYVPSQLHLANKTNTSSLQNNIIATPARTETPLNKYGMQSCDRRIKLNPHGMLLFKNITIRSKLGHAKAAEAQLQHPKENDEFYTLQKGFFTLYCQHERDRALKKLQEASSNQVLVPWIQATEIVNKSLSTLPVTQEFRTGYYLAIQRFEYANVYWTVIDLLDIFITTQLFDVAPEKLTIVLLDAHPSSSLDAFWSVLFLKTVRPVDVFFADPKDVLLENLLWRYPRIYCPFLDSGLQSVKYIQPFRAFVLSQFGIASNARPRNCSQLHVLVTFRRDYQNHPRNAAGIIDRKIANEDEVVNEMRTAFPSFNITAVQLDALPLKKQLELLAWSDVFFGMHGAAHAFSIFMPPGGVVIEMFNFNAANWHMKHVATLSGHAHITWTLKDTKAYNTKTRSTTIPSGVPTSLLGEAARKLCP